MIENLWGLIYFVFWIQGVEPPETLLLQGDTRMLNPMWLLLTIQGDTRMLISRCSCTDISL